MQRIANDIQSGEKPEEKIIQAIESQIKLGYSVDTAINGKKCYRETLLCVACANLKTSIVKTLLRRGASPNYQNSNGVQPLQLVLENRSALYEGERLAIIEALLIAEADVNCAASYDPPPLSLAAVRGFTSVVRELLRENVNIERGIKNAGSPLALAAMNGHEEVCRLLLAAGADAEGGEAEDEDQEDDDENVKDTPRMDGRTPLMLACENGFVNVAKLLVKHGADVTAEDELKKTALHCAAASGSVDCLKLLLETKPKLDLNQRDLTECTPLDLAIINRRFDAVAFFLDRDKFEVQDDAIGLVTNTRHLGLFKLFMEHVDPDISDLHVVLNANYIDGLEFMLQTVESFDCTKQQLQQLIDKFAKSEKAKELLRERIKTSDDDGKLIKVKKEAGELSENDEEESNQVAGSRRQRTSSETKPKPKNSAAAKKK